MAEVGRALLTGACAVLGVSVGATAMSGVDHFALQVGGFVAGSLIGHGVSHAVHSVWRHWRYGY